MPKARVPSENVPDNASTAAVRAARLGPRLLIIKAVALGALALLGAALSRTPWMREWLGPDGALAQGLKNLDFAAYPVFLLGSGLLIAVGVPRLLFCPIAGAAFGFWPGLLISTASTMAAYFTTFLFIRGQLADRETPWILPDRLAFLKKDPGIAGVILTRLIPVPGLLGTVALSLSPVRKRAFFAGSLIGLIPEAVPLLLLGAGMLEGSPRQLAWTFAGGLLLVVACLGLIRHLMLRHRTAATKDSSGE
ncbi:MAG: TVP38/TMEM64 family protein [Verrucomicrobiales bacterium]|nr:TVP38/TMEM64 family protein [Verrucomicrobiales bacterium]